MCFEGYRDARAQVAARNRPVHFAGLYDPKGEISLYVDGKLAQRTSTGTAAFRPSLLPFTLGANPNKDPNPPVDFFQGTFHQIRVSKRARYDRDFTPSRRFEPDADTLILYHFDEGEGTVLTDSSGNGHHGQIVGAKWVKVDGSAIDPKKSVAPPVYVPVTPEETQAKKLQAAWAAMLKVPVESRSKTGIALVLIPPSGGALPKPYYLGKFEVTQAEWEAVMGYNPSAFKQRNKAVEGLDTGRFPVENVSWFDCVEYCNKLSEMEGLKPYYALTVTKRNTTGNRIDEAEVRILGGNGYHIPTDAEWEHGCRAGTQTKYNFGDKDEDLGDYAWYADNSDQRPHVVGEKKPNAFELYDMHGNVNEWIEGMLTNATPVAPMRVNRGGGWPWPAGSCAMSNRFGRHDPSRSVGLRLARVPSGEASQEAKWPPPAVAQGGPLPPTFKNGIGMEFVIVPKGKSWLGGGKDKLGNKEVEIPADFYLSKYEVTQEEVGEGDGGEPQLLLAHAAGQGPGE